MSARQRAVHRMPFGAETRGGEGVRFRLWAPAQESVSLVLEDGEPAAMPMRAMGDGWFELTTDAAGPGMRYRFALQDGQRVPDPASRHQPEDVHGPSQVVDPESYVWRHAGWRGRPWHEAVLYELHLGTFTASGDFDGLRRRLDHLVELGVTALELMPVADFPGRYNWGYDGVLLFAPDSGYGRPDDLKRLIDEAHGRGLMMLLDVVYNHFGPDGNYLHAYAPQMFKRDRETAWGVSIDFSVRQVRDFFIHNALYWLEEFRFDGLRFDAVHAIQDDGTPHFLTELAETVRGRIGGGRHIHLVLENDENEAHHLLREEDGAARLYTAQWNDDFHHVAHHLLTGESAGYYADYQEQPYRKLERALREGFVYQGEVSAYRGRRRGEPSADLPPGAFVDFLQNHDQIGNRAFGERLAALAAPEALRAMTALLLLAPSPPLLFMGEEWGSTQPFYFFCSFDEALGRAVRDGRRKEFARFPEFADSEARRAIPGPNSVETARACVLDWSALDRPEHADWLSYYRALLRLRREQPFARGVEGRPAPRRETPTVEDVVSASWDFANGERLTVMANLRAEPASGLTMPPGDLLFSSRPEVSTVVADLPGWTTLWVCARPAAAA